MYKIDPNNGYDRNGKKINDHGGDTTDYMYNDDGEIISSISVKVLKTGTIGQDVDAYGLRIYNVKSGGLIDPSFDIFTSFAGGGSFLKASSYGTRYLL